MIVILKPCKWNDSKVSKTVARVFLSLVQAFEDLVFVDRGKLHPSAWVKDVCEIYMSVYHYYGFCNDQIFTSRFYFLCPQNCIQKRCAWYQTEPTALYIPVTNTNLDQSQLCILRNYVVTN